MLSQKLQIVSSSLYSVTAFIMRNKSNNNNSNSTNDYYHYQRGGGNDSIVQQQQQQYPKVSFLKLLLTLLMMIVSISSIIEFRRIIKQYKVVAATISFQKQNQNQQQKQQQRKTIGTSIHEKEEEELFTNLSLSKRNNTTEIIKLQRSKDTSRVSDTEFNNDVNMMLEVDNQHVTDTLDDQDQNSSTVHNQHRHRRLEETTTTIEQFIDDHTDVSSLVLVPSQQTLHTSTSSYSEQQHVEDDIATTTISTDNDTSNDNNDQGTSTSTSTSSSIVQYLQQSKLAYMISILKWNTSGILEQTSPINIPSWFNEQVGAHDYFLYTKPSTYGSVALFLNSDVLSAIPWSIIPPIPILLYTVPNTISNSSTCNLISSIVNKVKSENGGTTTGSNNDNEDQVTCLDHTNDDAATTMYKLLPNPYDRDQYNLYCLELAEQTTNKVPWNERNSTIVWRGIIHGASDPSRQLLLEMSSNASNSHWLDAVNVQEHPNEYLNFVTISYYKYQIDIGGESGTTWGSLRWKMCSGNLVFKVDTWSYDWWHSTIVPWKHYIPVHSNLSNLYEQYVWAENNPLQVQQIVQRAIRTCKETIQIETIRTYHQRIIWDLPAATESQMNEVDSILNNNLGNFYQPILERGK